jgi:hypothetical protein
MPDQPLLATITGEHFQPVRLPYRVFDREGLRRAFQRLRRLDYDAPQRRWAWLYAHEAQTLRFQHSHAQMPRHLHPLVPGSFFLRANDQLLLDLRSCERATHAVSFFDRHLPRTAAEVAEAEVVNRLFAATEVQTLTPDRLFDRQGGAVRDPEAEVRRVAERTAPVPDPQERLRVALADMQARAKQPLPEIERFPVHYYADGIQGLALALRLRQVVALQRWLGRPEYTLFDALQALQGPM